MSDFPPKLALFRMRLQMFKNHIRSLDRDSSAKIFVVFIGLACIFAVGFYVSYYSFGYIEKFPAIGVHLNSRLLGLLFMVLFAMVTLSAAIVSYTSLFVARETRFFFEQPIPPRLIFSLKIFESIAFSGWATFLLCLPVVIAFGKVRDVGVEFYFQAAFVLLTFILFCGLAGALVTVVILVIVRRWTFQKLFIAAGILMVTASWTFLRSFDFSSLDGEQNLIALERFTVNLQALQSPFFPSSWATNSLLAASAGHHREYFFQIGVLLANTLILVPVLQNYAQRGYTRRWIKTIEPAPFWRRRDANKSTQTRLRKNGLNTLFRGPMAVLVWKDLATFFRNPAQVSQFVLFLILTIVYVASLTQIPSTLFSNTVWELILHYANLTAICLILSSFTSRFLFPLISLEGRSFWILGLAPVDRSFLIHQKLMFGRVLIMSLGLTAAFFSSYCLKFNAPYILAALFITTLSSWVLTALAVGLGGAYPNFNEDNPARIAVGLGGTLNFFASAVTVMGLIGLEAAPYFIYSESRQPPDSAVWLSHVAALILALTVSHVAIRMGERTLKQMDF